MFEGRLRRMMIRRTRILLRPRGAARELRRVIEARDRSKRNLLGADNKGVLSPISSKSEITN